ncbi:hypothetical protein HMPREF9057_00938 [Actinomyces sp. oral taxon 171 str. F0337]|nr:hypothetical protein HMPREF9057_00938 [Actinomyces sp. oral taxon 171 str. F0337]
MTAGTRICAHYAHPQHGQGNPFPSQRSPQGRAPHPCTERRRHLGGLQRLRRPIGSHPPGGPSSPWRTRTGRSQVRYLGRFTDDGALLGWSHPVAP